jgi:membrane protein DedA with SNARE-associated domain
MSDLNTFLAAYGLTAIFILMLVKSAGVPIPIPADAVMLAASAQAAAGKFVVSTAFIALLVALVIGGLIQFALVRGPGRSVLYRYGRYLGLTPARLDAATEKLKQRGLFGISLAILTPGVRSVAVPACGLAGISPQKFIGGLSLGSGLFLALHFFIGFVGGTLLKQIGTVISLPLLLAVVVVLLLIGLGIWVIIRRRQLPEASNREVLAEALGAWHEATCPVCLALGAAERLQIHTHDHP